MKRFFCLFLLSLFFFYLIMPWYALARDEIVIEGLHIEKIVGGSKKIYSIEACRANSGNKRIGFFSFSLIKVINLEDVCFTLYNNDGQIVKTQHFNRAVYELNSRRLFDEFGNLVFCE